MKSRLLRSERLNERYGDFSTVTGKDGEGSSLVFGANSNVNLGTTAFFDVQRVPQLSGKSGRYLNRMSVNAIRKSYELIVAARVDHGFHFVSVEQFVGRGLDKHRCS